MTVFLLGPWNSDIWWTEFLHDQPQHDPLTLSLCQVPLWRRYLTHVDTTGCWGIVKYAPARRPWKLSTGFLTSPCSVSSLCNKSHPSITAPWVLWVLPANRWTRARPHTPKSVWSPKVSRPSLNVLWGMQSSTLSTGSNVKDKDEMKEAKESRQWHTTQCCQELQLERKTQNLNGPWAGEKRRTDVNIRMPERIHLLRKYTWHLLLCPSSIINHFSPPSLRTAHSSACNTAIPIAFLLVNCGSSLRLELRFTPSTKPSGHTSPSNLPFLRGGTCSTKIYYT